MRRSMSNRCERNTATPMDNGMSSKDNEKPASRSSSVSGVSPPTNERSTGSWEGKVPATPRVRPNTTHLVCCRCAGEAQKPGAQPHHPVVGAPPEDECAHRKKHQLEDLVHDDVKERIRTQRQ